MWNFQKAERASSEEMPIEIRDHVTKRGQLIKNLVSADDTILDVGCGEGIITAILATKNKYIIGCDYAQEALSKAKKKHPHIEFLYSNSTNLRFKNEIFSKVVFSDLAEHLMPVQFIKSLNEIRRVLRKGGTLILTTPLTGRGEKTSTYSHIYEYSEVEIKKILSNIFSSDIKLIDKEFGIFLVRKENVSC
jgi:ubiquinone/menaquinone biosynthesis C-methylase UbiE